VGERIGIPVALGKMVPGTILETGERKDQGVSSRGPSLDLDAIDPSHHLAENHAAQELLYRLNHARQTVDFVQRQAKKFSALQFGEMGLWEALDMLNELREYEAALLGDETCDPDMSLLDHALQTAELCRREFPDDDWMALVGLIHGLGKLLSHPKYVVALRVCPIHLSRIQMVSSS